MSPSDEMGYTFVEEDDWAPSPEIIRLLARQTASVMLPPPPVGSDLAGPPDKKSNKSSPKTPNMRSRRSKSSPGLDATLDTRTPSSTFDSRFGSPPWIPGGLSPGAASDISSGSPTKEGFHSTTSSTFKQGHFEGNGIHDVPWNKNIIRPHGPGLYPKATPKVCSCLRPFEPGQNRCVKCGTRRPVKVEENWRKMERASAKVDLDNNDPSERCFQWAQVYHQKKRQLQTQKQADEENFINKNGHFSPQLNEHSMAIADKWKKQTPIQDRTQELCYKREEYLATRRKQIDDAEVCQECTFCPRLHPKSVGMQGRDLKSLFRWDHRRAQKINTQLSAQTQDELGNCPFTPELTNTSRKIAEEYCVQRNVHDRLFEDSRRREIEFNEEQEQLKKLTPKCFSRAADESMKRSMSARSTSSPTVGNHRAWWEAKSGAQSAREVSKDKNKNAARASMSLLPNRLQGQGGGALRNKKGFAYNQRSGSEERRKNRDSRTYSFSQDAATFVHQKCVMSGGKNAVKLTANNSMVFETARMHTEEANQFEIDIGGRIPQRVSVNWG